VANELNTLLSKRHRFSLVLWIAMLLIGQSYGAEVEGTITIHELTDAPGGDYDSAKNSSIGDCKNRCLEAEKCLAFTFNTQSNVCWLKDGYGILHDHEFGVTGLKPLFHENQLRKLESETPGTPWHLVDLHYSFPDVSPFHSLSIDVAIKDSVDFGSRLYLAPINGIINGVQFYAGVQTTSGGKNCLTGDVIPMQSSGGAIFSRWKARDVAKIRMTPGGYCESSGYEGDFISVRNRYLWNAGVYRFEIRAMDPQRDETWVGYFITDLQTGKRSLIGSLLFPGKTLTLKGWEVAFIELFGGRIPFARIPKNRFVISNFQVNGEPVVRPRISVDYNFRRVPPFAIARRTGTNGDPIEVEIGRLVDQSKVRF